MFTGIFAKMKFFISLNYHFLVLSYLETIPALCSNQFYRRPRFAVFTGFINHFACAFVKN